MQVAGQLVTDVRIGLGYTAVELAGGQVGVAFTFSESARGCCSAFERMRPLSQRLASELVPLVESTDPIEAAVGLACVNALADELLRAAASCREVAIVGASTPMLPDAFSATNVTLLSGVVVRSLY
jgi:uncharacterized protein (DUF4213/DUF364 family)